MEGLVGSHPAISSTDVHPHPSPAAIDRDGGRTTFHFIDASPADTLETARKAAGDQDVRIGGGPTVVRDFVTPLERQPTCSSSSKGPSGEAWRTTNTHHLRSLFVFWATDLAM